MNAIPDSLLKLGFEPDLLESIDPETQNQFALARVMAVHRDRFAISNGSFDVPAEMTGAMMFGAASADEYPAVGDWVLATFVDDNTFAIIHQLLPRRSLLKRKTPGKKIDFQLIAANIDVAFIVQSLDANFNLRRLERYLVMVKQSRIEPVVLLSKTDLCTAEEISQSVSNIQAQMPALNVQPFSNKRHSDLNTVADLLTPRQTYCLLGSSGVGKTTLLNNLIGQSAYRTKSVRQKDGKGRHATTSRQLLVLASGAMIIDTPGMRELGNFAVQSGIDETFDEITELAQTCRFGDCSHVSESGCAVLAAVKEGRLAAERYQNYIKMTRESIHNEMSYYEKRVKDKQFSKHCKSVLKQKKYRR